MSKETKTKRFRVPDAPGHPRSGMGSRGELELCLRDAYAAGCNAARSNSLFCAMDYAKQQAPIVAERLRHEKSGPKEPS